MSIEFHILNDFKKTTDVLLSETKKNYQKELF